VVVIDGMIDVREPLQALVHTITLSLGKEFRRHARINQNPHTCSYPADVYYAWQRGLNEQINGLIRQYVAK
jgi:IS30 family transposase